jgi:hypothetical protein
VEHPGSETRASTAHKTPKQNQAEIMIPSQADRWIQAKIAFDDATILTVAWGDLLWLESVGVLYHRVEDDSDNFGGVFVHFR